MYLQRRYNTGLYSKDRLNFGVGNYYLVALGNNKLRV